MNLGECRGNSTGWIIEARPQGKRSEPELCSNPVPVIQPILHLLKYAVAIFLVIWVFRQVRRPSGRLGRRMVRAMNLGHATMTDWALQQLPISQDSAVLDIGCGGGRTVQRLAAAASAGKVVGLDYSPTCVAVSQETNASTIAAGRVQIEQGSVDAMPFPDCTFNLVTAVETHYYWPDLPANVREVFRVIKPGGTFALVAETYKGGPWRFLYGLIMPLLGAFLTEEEHKNLLSQAGFTDVETRHVAGKNWILAMGRRP
jgi:ubiquinone/menaquinone biosynthesis C-methylase UbiE